MAHSPHFLDRISPKGEPFMGRCILCGAERSAKGEIDECPNPDNVSVEDALVRLLSPPSRKSK